MLRIVGLTSGSGRNLLHIHDTTPAAAELELVVAASEDAPVLAAATNREIETRVLEQPDNTESIRSAVSEVEPDLVCLDDFRPTLTEDVLRQLPTVFDVHPSLLPAFPGEDAVAAALETGVRLSGCTVTIRTGREPEPIVTQEPVPVFTDDTPRSLEDRISTAMQAAYARAVGWFATGALVVDPDEPAVQIEHDTSGPFPARWIRSHDFVTALRYGENPHQQAAVYQELVPDGSSLVTADLLNPGAKSLSYNNYNDADAGLGLALEFDQPAAVVIKHTNPAGCAVAATIADAYDRALATDPMSAFGGVIALNRRCDEATARSITDSYKEVVVAPAYTDPALDVLRDEDNLRVLRPNGPLAPAQGVVARQISGGVLVQEPDLAAVDREDLTVVTDRKPTEAMTGSLVFAWRVVKHAKSNAIVFATGTETVGVGAGQMSRVDAVRIAAMKADEHAEGKTPEGGVMASDAFFPFPDGIEAAAEAGIEAVIQPGGSVNDDAVIAAADDHDMAMVFTGQRCFRHD